MVIGTLKVQVRIEGSRSLKDKRRVLKSVKDRISNMNIATAEVEDQELWQVSTLGFATVSNDPGHANSTMDHLMNLLMRHPGMDIVDSHLEIVHL
ncbi:MAG TPA: DUF503 domain-containing protein [Deltaproteobacteria bacterium]|nr:MAG: DUF503 domain-containing protein [Deltaproteobacteria bacterium]HDM32830.1 DUF503 domain-containing protein [Deltaproteobacteria bacterium]